MITLPPEKPPEPAARLRAGVASISNRRFIGCESWAVGAFYMKLTNDSYIILIGTKNFVERYYRDKTGWLKVSARGRKFRMTAEQVLNHILPAVAGIKPNLNIKVEHRDPVQNERSADRLQ